MSVGLKGNADGSGAIQVNGSDAITISTSLNTTFVGTANVAAGTLYPLVNGTVVASTSGTAIDFANIPSWVKRITVMFSGVSTSSTSNIQLQLGTGAGPTFTTSGYLGCAATYAGTIVQVTSGILLTANTSNAAINHGMAIITNITGNTWTAMTNLARSDGSVGTQGAASIALAAQLTAIRITAINGTDTFDAGSINILYE